MKTTIRKAYIVNPIRYRSNYEKETRDKNGNITRIENSNGEYKEFTYDEHNNIIYVKESNDYWIKYKYDDRNRAIYRNNSSGFWVKWIYDEQEDPIRREEWDGNIVYPSKEEMTKQEKPIKMPKLVVIETLPTDKAMKKRVLEIINNEIDLAKFKNPTKAAGAVIQRIYCSGTYNYASLWHYVEDLLTQTKLDVWKNYHNTN